MKTRYSANETAVRLTAAAMFTALTLLATFVLKIQTPVFGYIHLGDTFTLLSGYFLGPLYGGLAAGIGSALADLLGGYAVWVPGTFVIKFLSAAAASLFFRFLGKRAKNHGSAAVPALILSGIIGEAVMILGYFFYNILVVIFMTAGFTRAGFLSAVALSLSEIPFNLVQGASGISLSCLLAPALSRVPFLQSLHCH